jgi:zinc transport system ATP-binding protein
LNFSVEAGDYLCVVGENGSGKSTLIKGLLRLKQPKGGRVETGDGLKPSEIGYLPQQTAAQKDFPAGAFEVVLSGRLGMRGILPFYSKADKKAAAETMRLFDVYDLAARCYRELSGGQQQRVLLARALCSSVGDAPGGRGRGKLRLLFLDEPATGLDPVVSHGLYGQLSAVNRETGVAIVMVSHDMGAALKHAGKILHLDNRQLFFGATRDYIKSAAAAKLLKGDAPEVGAACGKEALRCLTR